MDRTYDYRRFDPRVETIAAEWLANPVMQSPWLQNRPVDRRHATSPWWATSNDGAHQAVLKPGPFGGGDEVADMHAGLNDLFDNRARVYVTTMPIAAIEKIAADLAYHLRLPVPPGALYENTAAVNVGCNKAFLSLKTFDTSETACKDVVRRMDLEQLAHFIRANSAMSVFKGWLQDDDPRRFANIVIDKDTLNPAFVDFSMSTLAHWRKPQGHFKPMLSDAEVITRGDLRQTLGDIQALPATIIHDTVENIPDDFMGRADKDMMIAGLLHRQGALRDLILKSEHTKTFDTAENAARYVRDRFDRFSPAFQPELDLDF